MRVPSDPPRGTRVNVSGAFRPFAGPDDDQLTIETRLTTAREHPVYGSVEHVAFLRRVAGIPQTIPDGWRLPRPCVVVQDNYSVHVSHIARAEYAKLAQIGLVIRQLPTYSPDFNPIEAVWRWVKYRGLVERFYAPGSLLPAVESACARYRPRSRRNMRLVP